MDTNNNSQQFEQEFNEQIDNTIEAYNNNNDEIIAKLKTKFFPFNVQYVELTDEELEFIRTENEHTIIDDAEKFEKFNSLSMRVFEQPALECTTCKITTTKIMRRLVALKYYVLKLWSV